MSMSNTLPYSSK